MPLLSLLYFVFLFKIESSVIVHNSTWPLLIVKQLLQHFVILYIYIKLVWVPHLYFIISLCNVHQFFLNFLVVFDGCFPEIAMYLLLVTFDVIFQNEG